MTTSSTLTYIGVLSAATLGALIGAMLLYCIGMILDVGRLEKIVDRYGHILRLKRSDIYKADEWFDKYGYWTVFFLSDGPAFKEFDIHSSWYGKNEFRDFYSFNSHRFYYLE